MYWLWLVLATLPPSFMVVAAQQRHGHDQFSRHLLQKKVKYEHVNATQTYEEALSGCGKGLRLAVLSTQEDIDAAMKYIKKKSSTNEELGFYENIWVAAFRQQIGPLPNDLWWWQDGNGGYDFVDSTLFLENEPDKTIGSGSTSDMWCAILTQGGIVPASCSKKYPALCEPEIKSDEPQSNTKLPSLLYKYSYIEPAVYEDAKAACTGGPGQVLAPVADITDSYAILEVARIQKRDSSNLLIGAKVVKEGVIEQDGGPLVPLDADLWVNGAPDYSTGFKCVAVSKQQPKLLLVDCEQAYTPVCGFSDSIIYYSFDRANHETARKNCKALGSSFQLAAGYNNDVLTQMKQKLKASYLGKPLQKTWMGLEQRQDVYEIDAGVDLNWVWINGNTDQEVTGDWVEGQPNDANGGEEGDEDCGALGPPNDEPGLYDEPCAKTYPYMCHAVYSPIDTDSNGIIGGGYAYAPAPFPLPQPIEGFVAPTSNQPLLETPPPPPANSLQPAAEPSSEDSEDSETPQSEYKSLESALKDNDANDFAQSLEQAGVLQYLRNQKFVGTCLAPVNSAWAAQQAQIDVFDSQPGTEGVFDVVPDYDQPEQTFGVGRRRALALKGGAVERPQFASRLGRLLLQDKQKASEEMQDVLHYFVSMPASLSELETAGQLGDGQTLPTVEGCDSGIKVYTLNDRVEFQDANGKAAHILVPDLQVLSEKDGTRMTAHVLNDTLSSTCRESSTKGKSQAWVAGLVVGVTVALCMCCIVATCIAQKSRQARAYTKPKKLGRTASYNSILSEDLGASRSDQDNTSSAPTTLGGPTSSSARSRTRSGGGNGSIPSSSEIYKQESAVVSDRAASGGIGGIGGIEPPASTLEGKSSVEAAQQSELRAQFQQQVLQEQFQAQQQVRDLQMSQSSRGDRSGSGFGKHAVSGHLSARQGAYDGAVNWQGDDLALAAPQPRMKRAMSDRKLDQLAQMDSFQRQGSGAGPSASRPTTLKSSASMGIVRTNSKGPPLPKDAAQSAAAAQQQSQAGPSGVQALKAELTKQVSVDEILAKRAKMQAYAHRGGQRQPNKYGGDQSGRRGGQQGSSYQRSGS